MCGSAKKVRMMHRRACAEEKDPPPNWFTSRLDEQEGAPGHRVLSQPGLCGVMASGTDAVTQLPGLSTIERRVDHLGGSWVGVRWRERRASSSLSLEYSPMARCTRPAISSALSPDDVASQ